MDEMKITLIGQKFDENSGQGIYNYSGNLYKHLKKINKDTNKLESYYKGEIWNNLFYLPLKSLFRTKGILHFMSPEVCLTLPLKQRAIVTFHDVKLFVK